jgi:hypothetical protein
MITVYVLWRGHGALTSRTETSSSLACKPRSPMTRSKASRTIISSGGGVAAFMLLPIWARPTEKADPSTLLEQSDEYSIRCPKIPTTPKSILRRCAQTDRPALSIAWTNRCYRSSATVRAQSLDLTILAHGLGRLTQEVFKRYKIETQADQVRSHLLIGFNQTRIFLTLDQENWRGPSGRPAQGRARYPTHRIAARSRDAA